jgi:AcrR family transcriptional regulator
VDLYSNNAKTVKRRRQVATEATERAIVEAAAELFVKQGYKATSIAEIAAAAGVAVQTIYNAVGSKPALLSRVLDFAAAGEQAPTPVPQFMRTQAENEPDPYKIIAQAVEFWRTALPRTAPILRLVRETAAFDSKIAELERARAAQRLTNYAHAARLLKARGALRDGLSIDDAAAVLFAVGHPETYRTLVIDGGWDNEHWARWARTTLTEALIGTPPQ